MLAGATPDQCGVCAVLHARDCRLAGAGGNLQSNLLPAPAPTSARRMMGNILPHRKRHRPPKPPLVGDAAPPRGNPMVGLLRPGFRRLQGLHGGQYKPASWRLRRACIIRACIIIMRHIYSAVGDTPPGLVVVEIAELPDKPPQAHRALRPPLTLEAGRRQVNPAVAALQTGARNCEAGALAPRPPANFQPAPPRVNGG